MSNIFIFSFIFKNELEANIKKQDNKFRTYFPNSKTKHKEIIPNERQFGVKHEFLSKRGY
jgi:hypothetical protein